MKKKTTGVFDRDFSFSILQNVLDMISKCDTNISYLLGAISLVVVFELNLINYDFFKEHLVQNFTAPNVLLTLTFLVGLFFTITTIGLCIYSLSPKIKNRIHSSKLCEKSVLYFGTISTFTYSQYKDKCEHLTDNELKNDLLSQIYINSIIANKKYRLLKLSSLFFVLSSICLFLFIVFQNAYQ